MISKPILFVDFDGTLCFDKYWRSLPEEKYHQIQVFMFGDDKKLFNDWMKGKYTAEEINQLVAEKIGILFEELWKLFVDDCKSMHVSREVLEKLSALRSTYTVILITGNMDSFARFTVPALGLENYFDYINNSFFEGKLKDDEGGVVFDRYAQNLEVSLGKCVLIDNSIKACESFKALGGTAFLITPENTIQVYLEKIINQNIKDDKKKDFFGWTKRKMEINNDQPNFYRARDIRWCSLGVNVGFEQDGTSETYRRPVLVIRGFSLHVCLVVPLTTSKKKNPYHVSVGIIEGREAFVILSQIRLIDTKRLHDRLCVLDKSMFEEIRKAIKDLI